MSEEAYLQLQAAIGQSRMRKSKALIDVRRGQYQDATGQTHRYVLVGNRPADRWLSDYVTGKEPPRYPVPACRLDIVYWDCEGISISSPGEEYPRYTYGRAFGHGCRVNYWEP